MKMTPATMKQMRTRELAQIHVAKKQLGWSDDEYRTAVLSASGGKTNSAGELDYRQRFALLATMKKCGFKMQPKKKQAVELDKEETSKLIRHLWLELHGIGAVRNPDETALLAYVKRLTGKDALPFLKDTQTVTIIESLKSWLTRERIKQAKTTTEGV